MNASAFPHVIVVALVTFGCKCAEQRNKSTGATSASAQAAQTAPAAPSAHPNAAPRSFPIRTGPRLAILAGQGVGPIRIGATVATIERHMQAPCDYVDDRVCRYIGRAIEFHLRDGVTESMTIHRRDRAAGKDKQGRTRTYGIFNGAIPPDLQPGMVPAAIIEFLGEPDKVDKQAPNQYGTEEIHHYPGLRLEYDRIANGNLVLGAIHIFKDPKAKPPKLGVPIRRKKPEVVH